MSDLRELYQEMIVDHTKRPRNYGKLEQANRSGEGYNPLCGDRVKIYLFVEQGIIKDIRFEGAGCAISIASASLMTEALKGKPETEVQALFGDFHELVTKDPTTTADISNLGKLAALGGVSEYPMRVKCATLAWHTLLNALTGKEDAAVTE